jgi:pantothenate kinase type III
MNEIETKSIVFPATDAAGEAKLKALLEKIADYMGVDGIRFDTVIVMSVVIPSDRQDFISLVKRIASSKKV